MKVFTEEVTTVLCFQRSPKDQESEKHSGQKFQHIQKQRVMSYPEYVRKCKSIFTANDKAGG